MKTNIQQPKWLQTMPRREDYFNATGSTEFGNQEVETGHFNDEAHGADLHEYFNSHRWFPITSLETLAASKVDTTKPLVLATTLHRMTKTFDSMQALRDFLAKRPSVVYFKENK